MNIFRGKSANQFISRLSLLIGLLTLLAGCASPPQALSQQSAISVQKIVIVGPEEPSLYTAISGNAVLAMGATAGVGGIAGASASASALEAAQKRGDFDAEMRITLPHLAQEFRDSLAQRLASDGYTVTQHLMPHEKGSLNYSNVTDDVDAIFDATVWVAMYESDAFSSTYTPTLVIEARLIDKKTGKLLYRSDYNYGGHSKTNVSGPEFSFNSYQELISNPRKAADGFQSGIPVLVDMFARDLQKRP